MGMSYDLSPIYTYKKPIVFLVLLPRERNYVFIRTIHIHSYIHININKYKYIYIHMDIYKQNLKAEM